MAKPITQRLREASAQGQDISGIHCEVELEAAEVLDSAVDTLRCIAAMEKKAGSAAAKNWLFTHDFALEDGGYIPGKGFEK